MHQFIESICIKNGIAENLDLHQHRMDRTYHYFFKKKNPFDLNEVVQDIPASGVHKMRIIYDEEIKHVNTGMYIKTEMNTLKMVEANHVDYDFKFHKREVLEELFLQRDGTDNVIICKNGLVTDSCYANLVFWDGYEWFTPNTPLLMGVKRQFLLNSNQIKTATIKAKDIQYYEKVSLVNAMLDLGDTEVLCSEIEILP